MRTVKENKDASLWRGKGQRRKSMEMRNEKGNKLRWMGIVNERGPKLHLTGGMLSGANGRRVSYFHAAVTVIFLLIAIIIAVLLLILKIIYIRCMCEIA
jgi:hypothetical protein